MTASEISRLLSDRSRVGAPEPSLLPWLTRRIALSGLPRVAEAGVGSLFAARDRWPVIADAVAAIVAEREPDPASLSTIISILPPVAAHLDAGRRAAIDWDRAGSDAAVYAVLADQATIRDEPPARRRPWVRIAQRSLWGRELSTMQVPPLADFRSLLWLSARPPRDAGPDSDQQAAYLLPFHYGPQTEWQALEAIEAAVRVGHHWYAAALLARAAPYLDDRTRAREAIVRMPEPWSSHLMRFADEPTPRWERDEDELAASHPAVPLLDDLAADVRPVVLARTALAAVNRIMRVHRLNRTWDNVPDLLIGTSEPQQAYRAPDRYQEVLGLDEDWPEPSAKEAPSSSPLDLPRELAEPDSSPVPPSRYLNVYVAAAGQQEPAPPRPLALRTDYVVRCNIGSADIRSLVKGEAAEVPESLLPAGPLDLRVALFVDDRMVATTHLELPSAGSSAWQELPLPRMTEARLVRGDIAVYYGSAMVLMYGLVVPFGGDSGPGPEAVPRYRLSRSLADLGKLDDRSLSLATGGSGHAKALYVNGLTFAPFGFTYQTSQVNRASRQVRDKLFAAHFAWKKIRGQEGPVSRYQATRDFRYVKSVDQLEQDLREMAQLGSLIYDYLFRDGIRGRRGGQIRLRDFLRDEAEARGRPPVVQAVSVSDQFAPIPWAALYDLPMGSDIRDYVPCKSIAQFGPCGSGAEPPARCPHEDSHRRGDGWRRDQLCPWGFWGLSAIIEHPPGTQARDLETQVRPYDGPPVIMVGYDTKLDAGECQRHLRALQDVHGRAVLQPFVATRGDALDSLGLDNMDVVYLYCHVLSDPSQPGQDIPAIQFGERRITQQDINTWSDNDWSVSHWAARHPLVILNGCGSVEKGPGSLANLVDAFVGTARASGVIGTEITIEQGVGGWAMELFLSAFRDYPVGEALRSVRWKMFSQGNLIGLAYTPYCLAQLALSAPQESA